MSLTPSQRISAVTEIAHRLNPEGWAVIDLTLDQFGLPTSAEWSGSAHDYLIAMVKGGTDSQLLELAKHVGLKIDAHSEEGSIETAFWRKEFFRVFISHLAAHRAFAAELQKALLYQGITSFVAHNDIEPTTEWQGQIELGLQTCHALAALLHPNFHESRWTDQEVGYAMGRGIPVFSIRLGSDPYGFIGRYQGFNGNGKSAAQLAVELGSAYRKNKETAALMASSTVAAFEQSGSYDAARTRMGYLEDLAAWDENLRDRVSQAVEQNGEINGSWGVPDRITKLLEKWKSN